MYKLMVIDDEQIIREGIIHSLVNCKIGFEVVGEAANGKQALEMIPEMMPDIIITDICMPLLNGIEFIEIAKSINPDIKVVIISGYDDFEYAQKALRLGVYDYLLKPVQAEKLISILVQVKEELDKHNSFLHDMDELKKQIIVSLPVIRDRFFHELISGRIKAGELEQRLNYLDLQISGRLCAIALIKIKNRQSINKEFAGDEGLLQCYIIQITENIFPEFIKPYIFFTSDDKMVVLLTTLDKNRQRVFISLNQILKRIILSIERGLNIDAYAAMGRLYDDALMLYKSYSEAEEAIQFSFLKDKGSVVNYEDINTPQEIQYNRPLELEKQLLTQIKLSEEQAALQTIEMILEYYRGLKDVEPSRIKLLVFEITILLLRTIEETGGMIKNIMKDEKLTPYECVYQCETFLDLQQFLYQFVMNCIHEIEKVRAGKGYTIVEKAKEIVAAALDNSEFSMDDVAARLFISPNYLRSLFKQQLGESFVEYLTRIRMEKAQKLLDDATLKIHNIAEKVGYLDQHYFSMCFKKYFGLTPTDYREAKMISENRNNL
jgi:two-component system, response regulator YesN